MNRLFGKGKDKVPPPNLGDQVANVSFIFLIDLLLILGLNDQAKRTQNTRGQQTSQDQEVPKGSG